MQEALTCTTVLYIKSKWEMCIGRVAWASAMDWDIGLAEVPVALQHFLNCAQLILDDAQARHAARVRLQTQRQRHAEWAAVQLATQCST